MRRRGRSETAGGEELQRAGESFEQATFAQLICEGALEIGDGYRAKNEELGGEGLIFLRAGHVNDTHIDFNGVERFHSELDARLQSKLARSGDAVITTKGNSTGRTTFVSPSMPPFVYSPHLSYWRSLDPARIEGGFLRYWCKSREFTEQLSGMKASTDMAPYLSLLDQKRLHIALPPIDEQRAIAHILGTLDDKIELNRRMNETLEAMARTLFKSWFVDFDPVRAAFDGRQELRGLEGATIPRGLMESVVGPIPQGWRAETLGAVVSEIETGSRPLGGATSTGVPSIGAESIVGLGRYDFGKTKYVPHEYFAKMSRGRFRSRDILLYKDGGRPGEFEPHVAMLGDGFPFDEWAINEHVYRIRANQEVGQNFLFFWLSSQCALAEMRNLGTGVAIPGLNSTNARAIGVLVPTAAFSTRFEQHVEPLVATILRIAGESKTLATLRDALLPKLLSGEIRVKDVERQVETVL